jgi:hypothetical protein
METRNSNLELLSTFLRASTNRGFSDDFLIHILLKQLIA